MNSHYLCVAVDLRRDIVRLVVVDVYAKNRVKMKLEDDEGSVMRLQMEPWIVEGVKPVISREHQINLDPIPPLDNYRGDEIEDIGDAENEPPINNGPNE
ncbi:unnamed protein product [Vicia faba]|uniref:Uncharacterized protein n=1 Tax=Vicia faba TaxID=3906 RepID=A0AAV1BA02_VICFA|nr:unnamed protein product [Vicia faba]